MTINSCKIVKTFIFVTKIYNFSNKFCSFELFIWQGILKKYQSFHKNIKQDNYFWQFYYNNQILLFLMISVSWAVNKHIWIISEGSCDTEDCSINAENSALTSHE